MRMQINNHYLFDDNGRQVTFKLTPNRGGLMVPKYLIMHYDASGNSTGAVEWMLNPASKVSAHLHITRDGEVTQLAPFNIVCWHAGKSEWAGLIGLNAHSIGIELQNTGTQEYTENQLAVCEDITRALVTHYQLKDVLGHSDIAPGRKIDPGPRFPMDRFKVVAVVQCGVKTTADLNLRRGAGTGYPIITVLPKDTTVEVLNVAGNWSNVKVVNSHFVGWVSNQYLTNPAP